MSKNNEVLKKTICPLDCPDSCGLIAKIQDDKVVGLYGDKEHPYTRGVICRKMKNYYERVYSQERILHPLKRVGPKGAGKFERISWDEAYVLLTEKISAITNEFGGEAILPFVYAGNMGAVNRFAGYPLFNKLGISWLDETICSSAAKAGWRSHCGDVPGSPPEVASDAELIFIWGSNTKVTNMHFWPYVTEARKKGAKLVVIDPYRNITASSADIHLKVKPGEDAALALGLLKVVLEEDGIDRNFVKTATDGFSYLEKYLGETKITSFINRSGIELSYIQEVVKLILSTKRIFFRLGIGMTRNSRAAMSIRAITSLAAVLGLFDGGEGRGVLLSTGAFKGDQQKLTWPSLATKQTRKFNMVQIGNCLTSASPPIKMLMVYNSNPLSVVPDSSLVRQALESEDLFTIVHEQVMTPTATYADLLLPATTFLENKDLYTAYGHFYMGIADPVIAYCGEAKSNFTFFQELALKLGFDDIPFKQTLDERLSDYLSSLDGLPAGLEGNQIKPGQPVLSVRGLTGQPTFSATEKKYSFIQTTNPSLPLHACLIEAAEFDDADYLARYPFKLIAPPHMNLLNSTFGERYPGEMGEVLVHPEDSRMYNIHTGDVITIYNNRGSTVRTVKVTDATQQGLLVAEGIFWENQVNPSGINDVTSQKLTDMGGGGTYHESRVAVKLKQRRDKAEGE